MSTNAYRVQMTKDGPRFVLVTESSAPRRREDPIVMPMMRAAQNDDDTLGRIDQALKDDNFLRRMNRALSSRRPEAISSRTSTSLIPGLLIWDRPPGRSLEHHGKELRKVEYDGFRRSNNHSNDQTCSC